MIPNVDNASRELNLPSRSAHSRRALCIFRLERTIYRAIDPSDFLSTVLSVNFSIVYNLLLSSQILRKALLSELCKKERKEKKIRRNRIEKISRKIFPMNDRLHHCTMSFNRVFLSQQHPKEFKVHFGETIANVSAIT